jgi:type I restriction enzyme S subunit
MPSNYKRLGDYIQEVNFRNTDLKIDKLIGVSIEKKFISSVANIVGTDMSVYKIIKKNQLACKLMSVGRDEKLPVDLYLSDEPAIISSAYYVFESKDHEVLLPEYLKMWLFRTETDRYVGYISGGDVRGGISWDTFCDMPVIIPSIEKQREIVREYNTIQNRIALNNQLISKLEDTAQAIYKHWFVDFEFPDENGLPYKSNDGKMTWCNELDKEIPTGWLIEMLKKLCDKIGSGSTPKGGKESYFNSGISLIRSMNIYDFNF